MFVVAGKVVYKKNKIKREKKKFNQTRSSSKEGFLDFSANSNPSFGKVRKGISIGTWVAVAGVWAQVQSIDVTCTTGS